MTALSAVPIFPLHAVLFPEGKLPLRIFEPRYLELVKRSLKEDAPFVIAALLSGQEVLSGAPEAGLPRVAPVACLVRIVDFDALADGTLGITVAGEGRVRIDRSWEGPGRLLEGDLTALEPWSTVPPRADQAPLLQVLSQLLEHPAVEKLAPVVRWEEAWSVAARLTELLPFTPGFKQALLAEVNPLQMLDAVGVELDELREADGA
ncbi:MAG: LON peptidase substrate-binding domain-containing protein [Pseudomonadales bacterium]|jgi:Lon protease-like protein